jgi:hypothetical protein
MGGNRGRVWGVFPIAEGRGCLYRPWHYPGEGLKEFVGERPEMKSLPRNGRRVSLLAVRQGPRGQSDQVALTARPMPRTARVETSRPDRISDMEAPTGEGPPVSGSIDPSDSPVHSFTQMPTQ